VRCGDVDPGQQLITVIRKGRARCRGVGAPRAGGQQAAQPRADGKCEGSGDPEQGIGGRAVGRAHEDRDQTAPGRVADGGQMLTTATRATNRGRGGMVAASRPTTSADASSHRIISWRVWTRSARTPANGPPSFGRALASSSTPTPAGPSRGATSSTSAVVAIPSPTNDTARDRHSARRAGLSPCWPGRTVQRRGCPTTTGGCGRHAWRRRSATA